MSEKIDIVTYSQKHVSIVTGGIHAIKEAFADKDELEIRGVLLCLDQYLDPYYGYNLPYSNEIIALLEENLFQTQNKKIKSDIIDLLRNYAHNTLDHLAENLKSLEAEPDLLEKALYALGNTGNLTYLSVITRYILYPNPYISGAAKEIVTELSQHK